MAYYDMRTGKRVSPPSSGCLPMILFGIVLLIAMFVSIIDAMSAEMLILSGLVILLVIAFIVSVFKKAFAGNTQQTNASEEKTAAVPSNSHNMDAYKLANVLKGQAPAHVLKHCDSIMHNAVLLETYIMQCNNNGEISSRTASLLRERYAAARAQANSSEAVNQPSAKTQTAPSPSYNVNDLERYYHLFYNSVPDKQCVDQLCKLYGREHFHTEICNSTQFCQAVYSANQTKDLLDYIHRNNPKAAYIICLESLIAKAEQ